MDYELEILKLKQRVEQLEELLMLKAEEKPVGEKQNNRDKTKYMFENKVYAKNRLVLAVIKKYVLENNPSLDDLTAVFDKSLQGSLGVVERLDKIQTISDAGKRFFIKDEDIIVLSDGTKIAVCTQWGIFNIKKFITLAEKLNYNITLI
ncbi:MAG: hypothetical protein IKB42_05175 [Clostridia bacterium]|nr:hypothetical protein [Clostridia bacterium]